MHHAPSPSISVPSTIVRLLVALVLGSQVGLIVFIPSSLPWLSLGPVGILLLALLLSILFDSRMHQHEGSGGRLRRALRRVSLVLVAPLLVLVVLGIFLPGIEPLGAFVTILELSVVVAFTVGSHTIPLAIGSALIAWFGAGIFFLLSASLQAHEPGNDFGSLIFGLIAFLVFLGFGVAALGGLLGRFLRTWALR
jgi:hypothetical protein